MIANFGDAPAACRTRFRLFDGMPHNYDAKHCTNIVRLDDIYLVYCLFSSSHDRTTS